MQTKPRLKWQRALTVERLEIIRRNLDKTDAVVAQMLGVHRSAVHQLRQRYEVAKVHGTRQRTQRTLEKVRRLKPGLTSKAAAMQLGFSLGMVKKYGEQAGYEFQDISHAAARHFHWQKRMKSLPPQLTVTAVARELGVTYGYAALLCHRYKYKARLRTGRNRLRVPIRHFQRRPEHEHWLASLKPAKR